MDKREVAVRLADIIEDDRLVAFSVIPPPFGVPHNISSADKGIILEALREYGKGETVLALSIKIADLPEFAKFSERLVSAETLIKKLGSATGCAWANMDMFQALARRWLDAGTP